MAERKKLKLVTVKVVGIEEARRSTRENWGSPTNPWYEDCIGEKFEVLERSDYYFVMVTGGVGRTEGYSCSRNRTICKGDVEVLH